MPSNATLTHPFNCLLDDGLFAALDRMAAEDSCSKATVVRNLLRLRAHMTFGNTPYCADGGKCRCPHAHVYGPQNIPVHADPDRPL